MLEKIIEVLPVLISLITALGSVFAIFWQKRKDVEDRTKSTAESKKISADASQVLIDAASDVIEQYKAINLDTVKIAEQCKCELEKIREEMRAIKETNIELVKQNAELLAENSILKKDIEELKAVVRCLTEQIEDLGQIPKFGKRANDNYMKG